MIAIQSSLACVGCGITIALVLQIDSPRAPTREESTSPLDAEVTCPPQVEDRPVGSPIRPERIHCLIKRRAESWKVAAAPNAPHIAVWSQEGEAALSVDGGVTFEPVFAGRHVDALAYDHAGTLFVRAGHQLGRRPLVGPETWQVPAACAADECSAKLAVAGNVALLYGGSDHLISRDGGATWEPGALELGLIERVSGRRGALHALMPGGEPEHGPGEDKVLTIDRDGEDISSVSWDHHLETSDEVRTSWTWRVTSEDENGYDASKPVLEQVLAAKLHVVDGARQLAVFQDSLVELCGLRARQVYRRFPFSDLDAVDWAGRPLVMAGGVLLQWSPLHGWRELARFSPIDLYDCRF